MVISKIDIRILKVLRKPENEAGITLSDLSKKLRKDPGQLCRRLSNLRLKGHVSKARGFHGVYYKLVLSWPDKIGTKTVLCNKCKALITIPIEQHTAVCPNESCFNRKGKRTRLYLFEGSIKEYNLI